MRKRVNLRVLPIALAAIVLSMNGLFGIELQTLRAQTTSADNSRPQAIPVTPDSTPTPNSSATPDADAGLRAACQETLNELTAARKLLRSQDAMIEKQNELAGIQSTIETGLKNLRTMDADEKAQLRRALAAADRQISALEAEVVVLKKQRATFWKKMTWFIVGGAAGVIAGAIISSQ